MREAQHPVEPAIELAEVTRTYRQGAGALRILDAVNLVLAPGEVVALVGPSGAGKSTLLQIAGLLDRPDKGEVRIDGESCRGLSDDLMSRLRNRHIGFVFQFHHLLPEFTATENVILPQLIAGLPRGEARMRALELLDMMGLTERADHRPSELSGGEQQRVAIARGLANVPRVLLADEPTGNLDVGTGGRVMGQLVNIVHETGVAALVATHNLELAARMDRVLRLEDGHLVQVEL